MWVANEELIAEAGRRLAEASPDSQVILFGPHALEEASSHDEVGFLVIEPKVDSETEESTSSPSRSARSARAGQRSRGQSRLR